VSWRSTSGAASGERSKPAKPRRRPASRTLESAEAVGQALLAEDYFLLPCSGRADPPAQRHRGGYQRSLQLTRNQYAVGVAARADVAQAENATQVHPGPAPSTPESSARSSRHAIAVLLGKAPADFSVAGRIRAHRVSADTAGIASELLERRPDIAAQTARGGGQPLRSASPKRRSPSLTLRRPVASRARCCRNCFRCPAVTGRSVGAGADDLRRRAAARKRPAMATYDAEMSRTIGRRCGTDSRRSKTISQSCAFWNRRPRCRTKRSRPRRESLPITLNQYRAGTANYLAVVVVQATALANERTAAAIQSRRLPPASR